MTNRSAAPTTTRPRRAFLTDLDGTLLRSDGTLSSFSTEVLSRAIASGQDVIGVSFIASTAQLEPLAARVRNELPGRLHHHLAPDPYLVGYSFLEFTHPHAHKGRAMRTWAELVGVAAHDITVFGDNLNDRELFAGAGVRVAVGNAHHEIRAAADAVVAHNDADGVARYLADQLWPGEPARAGAAR